MGSSRSLADHLFQSETYIGPISQVGSSAVQLTLMYNASPEELDGHQGPIPIAEVGTFVLLSGEKFAVFGEIIDVSMPEVEEISSSDVDRIRRNVHPLGSVKLLSTIKLEDGSVSAGVLSPPRVGSKAYLAPVKLIKYIFESRGRYVAGENGAEKEPILLNFAHLPDTQKTVLDLTPERVFGSHCAIVGATGGGKSWSVARLVEECARYRSKVVLFDASGEFHQLTGGVRHVYLGKDPHPPREARQVVLPYHELTEGDLFAIFKPEGVGQAPKLRSAMKSLKLARLDRELAPDGTILKADRAKKEFDDSYRDHYKEVESSRAKFDIRKLTRQIENECVNPNRSPVEPHFWGGPNSSDLANCTALIHRIEDITRSEDLRPLFRPHNQPSLLKELDNFLDDPSARVLRVSLQYLSFAHHTREIIANAAGRHLLRLARENRFRNLPVLVVVDEAHQFLNKNLDQETSKFPLDSFGMIAKEGRKYGLNICLATQRPRDIPEAVMSQMGTLVVHRLINDYDRSVVERASGEMDRSSAALIPTLSPGQAVIVGVDFPVPLAVKVVPPKHKPDSHGPNFQEFWQ